MYGSGIVAILPPRVMGLVKVSADCVMVTSTGLTPSAVKRTMPVRFSVSFFS